jgi:hypothetical protein
MEGKRGQGRRRFWPRVRDREIASQRPDPPKVRFDLPKMLSKRPPQQPDLGRRRRSTSSRGWKEEEEELLEKVVTGILFYLSGDDDDDGEVAGENFGDD